MEIEREDEEVCYCPWIPRILTYVECVAVLAVVLSRGFLATDLTYTSQTYLNLGSAHGIHIERIHWI